MPCGILPEITHFNQPTLGWHLKLLRGTSSEDTSAGARGNPALRKAPAFRQGPSRGILHRRLAWGSVAGFGFAGLGVAGVLPGVIRWFYLGRRRAPDGQSLHHRPIGREGYLDERLYADLSLGADNILVGIPDLGAQSAAVSAWSIFYCMPPGQWCSGGYLRFLRVPGRGWGPRSGRFISRTGGVRGMDHRDEEHAVGSIFPARRFFL